MISFFVCHEVDSPTKRIGCIKCKQLFHSGCILNKSPNPNKHSQTCEECDVKKAGNQNLDIKKKN